MQNDQKFTGYSGEVIDDGFGTIPAEALDGKIIPERDFISGTEVMKNIRTETFDNLELVLENRELFDSMIAFIREITGNFSKFITDFKGIESHKVSSSGLQYNFLYYGTPMQVEFLSPFNVLFNGKNFSRSDLMTEFQKIRWGNYNKIITEVINFYNDQGFHYERENGKLKFYFQRNFITSITISSYDPSNIAQGFYEASKKINFGKEASS